MIGKIAAKFVAVLYDILVDEPRARRAPPPEKPCRAKRKGRAARTRRSTTTKRSTRP